MWIGKILMTEPDINDENLFKNLEIFNKVGGSTDLYSFKDYGTFLDFLEKRSKEVQMGKMAQIKAGIKTIEDNKRWLVVAPQTHDASKYFGGGTSWCISTSNDRYWKDYYYTKTIVMIKDRSKKPDNLLFKVAIVGNASERFWRTNSDNKLDKITELVKHVNLWDTDDVILNPLEKQINYLNQLPEDLIDDLMNYFNDDDPHERQSNYNYDLAHNKFQEDGKDLILQQLYNATVEYLDADTDLDEDEFGEVMSKQFADEIQDGNWDEFLSELWSACITSQGVDDDDFHPDVRSRNLKNLISDTTYDQNVYIDLAREVLKNSDVSNMDDIIKGALIVTQDNGNPYTVIRRHANQLQGTTFNDILFTSLKMYNAKYNPNYMQQRSFGAEFAGVINKFTPRNIEDVVKVLSINPRAKDMVDMIQKYRRDLYESKKMSIKYRDFYKF
jgi:hypothetical protein